jgi:putative ABC transport system permease protein
VFLAVGVAAVAAASAGPIYLAAADQSIFQVQLAAQLVTATGFTISSVPGGPTPSPTELVSLASQIPGGSGAGMRFGPPILDVDVSTNVANPLAQMADGIDFVWRSGVCAQLKIVSGSCPVSPTQVLISTRSASAIGARVGSRLGVKPALFVSGLYAAPTTLSNYWWGVDPFVFGSPRVTGELLDDGFVDQAGAARLSIALVPTDEAQLPFNASSASAPDVPAIIAQLAAYSGVLGARHFNGSTPIGGVFTSIETQEKQMRSVVGVIALELVVLALIVLYEVAASTSAERGPDMVIAELRGLTRRSIALLALREPALLLLLAAPAGLLLGWLVIGAVITHLLASPAPARIDSLSIGTAAATLVAGVGASTIGARSLLRPSLLGEARATTATRAARTALLVDAVALVLAAVALTELVTSKGNGGALGGSGAAGSGGTAADPLAALAPALLGLAAGVVGARLLPIACGAIARSTRWSSRVATALACRSLMRRPGLARRVIVPAIAVGLLVFSVASYEVARANRATQALFQTGAPVVLDVNVAPGSDLVAAVRHADPTGREAMAVAEIASPSGSTLAVDSSRFAAVAAWPAGISSLTAAQVAAYLSPPTAQPLVLEHATDIRLRLDVEALVRPEPILELEVFDETGYAEDEIDVGSLAPGMHTYTASLEGGCLQTCRLDSFTPFWRPAAGSSQGSTVVPLLIGNIETAPSGGGPWRAVPAGLSSGSDWVGSSSAAKVRATPQGLLATFDINASATPSALQRADVPPLVPAVVTSDVASANVNLSAPGQYPAISLGGENITVLSPVTAAALPEVGASAVLVDLSFAERLETASPADAAFEVWCHAAPSGQLLRALASQGVTVTGTRLESSAAEVLNGSGPALAFDLFVLAAIAGGLLAVGSLVFAIASGSRKRAVEIAALLAVGVPRSTLRRSLFAEYGAVAVAGVGLGLLSGVVTIRLALVALPEFVPGRVGPVLGIWVPWSEILLTSAVALVLLLTATLATSLVMRRATPDCLRVSM